MPVILRSATLDNLPAMIAIEQRAPTAAHWTAGQYERLLGNGFVWIAEQEGEICGFVCAKVVAGEWEIENVVVAGEFLRQGIADRLMQALLDQAEKCAASRILLEVRESNLPARRLYEKHGFREVGRRPKYYNNPLEDAILYALRCESDNQR